MNSTLSTYFASSSACLCDITTRSGLPWDADGVVPDAGTLRDGGERYAGGPVAEPAPAAHAVEVLVWVSREGRRTLHARTSGRSRWRGDPD